MKTKSLGSFGVFGFVLCATILSLQTGCYTSPGYSSTTVRTVAFPDDDYVYYPGYEVYYSNNHHHYIYRDGRRWVTRPAPARVSIDALLASPSVHLDFHDAPEHHHANVIRTYPKNWRPPGNSGEHRRDDHRDDKKDWHDHDHR